MPNYTVSANIDTMLRAADNAAIRSAIGLGQTDAPIFYGVGLVNGYLGGNGQANGCDVFTNSGVFRIGRDASLSWNGGANQGVVGADTSLFRDAAGILAQRNGTAAQAFRVYNTYTDANNYSRLKIGWDSAYAAFTIEGQQLGSGGGRSLALSGGGNVFGLGVTPSNAFNWVINGAHLLAGTDNTCDIGASGANRPRDIYVGRYLIIGSSVGSTGAIGFSGRSYIKSVSDGLFTLSNTAETDFNRLQLGGTTSAFPALKRNGTGIDIRLADDSTYAPLAAASLSLGVANPVADLDIADTWNAPAINVTGASGNGTTAVITFATQATAIPVGSTIVVAGINPSGYNGTFVVTASSVTSVSYLNATTTAWVSGGTIERLFTSVKLNVTDTASNAASKLMDLQVGGVSKVSAEKSGLVTSAIGFRQSATGAGIQVNSNGNRLVLCSNSVDVAYLSEATFALTGSALFGWAPGGPTSGVTDLLLARDAAGILAQRNGTAAQTFRVYNTFPGTGNNEFAEIAWSANYMYVRPAASGSGVVRGSVFGVASSDTFIDGSSTTFRGPGNTQRWTINLSGHFIAATDNAYDIGASGANRPRNIYVGTSIFCESDINGARDVYCGNNRYYRFNVNGTTGLSSSGAGILTMADLGATNTTPRITLGGTTSAFPAIKRNGTGIDIKLADDSAFAPLSASSVVASGYFSTSGYCIVGSSNGYFWPSKGGMYAPSDGVIRLSNDSVSGFTRLELGTANLGISRGTGSPEGVVTALVGSLYIRTDGGAATTLYVKESSPTPSTGWVGK